MGNFLQDVGRSTFQGSIKDMIQTKLNVDQDERLGVAAANASALSAEQLIQTKRANEVAAEKVKYDNVPLPVSVLADSFEGGAEGPIFKYAYNKFRGMGLIDETNPNNPTVLRKHANEYGQKMFTDNAPEINNIRLDWLNQNKKAIQQELVKKPGDEKLSAQLESINTNITQATFHDAGLKEEAKLKSTEAVHAATNATSVANNAATNAAHLQASQNSAAATIKAAQLRLDHEKANDPTAKMPPRIKLAFDWMKAFQAKTQPSNLLMYLASTGDATAKADIQKMQDFGKDPENIRLALKYSKLVEDYISGIETQNEPDEKPRELTESDILFNMKKHGKTREEIKAKFNQLYKREH